MSSFYASHYSSRVRVDRKDNRMKKEDNMKTKKLSKKLALTRQTISNLNNRQLDDIHGGAVAFQTTILAGCGIFGRCITDPNCPTQCGSNIDCSC